MDVDENNMPFFDLPDAPSSKTDRPPGWNANGPSSSLDATGHQDTDMDYGNGIDEISCFKRVILVDVEMHVKDIMGSFPPCTPPPNRTGDYYPFSATPSPTGAHGFYSPRTGPSPRQHSRHETSGNAYRYSPRKSSYSHRASYGDSDDVEDDYTDYLVDGEQDSGPYYYYQDPGSANGESDESPTRRRRRESSTTSERPRPTRATPKKAPPTPKATEADARKHRIPPGYSLKNWDPTEEPIMLLGSVFDANSLGKWIYDWAVYHHGSATSLADMAGELWLLLIQLAGKVKRAEECMPRIRKEENRETVDDFIESGERLTDKLKKLLKTVETSMLKAGKRKEDENNFVGKNAGIEFVDSIFGPDRQLEATEKFMQSIRLWNLRFDANCEDILRRPGQF